MLRDCCIYWVPFLWHPYFNGCPLCLQLYYNAPPRVLVIILALWPYSSISVHYDFSLMGIGSFKPCHKKRCLRVYAILTAYTQSDQGFCCPHTDLLGTTEIN